MLRSQRALRTLPSWLRLGRDTSLWTLATVVGVSGVGLLTSDASWLGATDDRVAAVAVDTYGDFLRGVATAIGMLAIVQWVFLTVVAFGLVLLVDDPKGHRPSRRARTRLVQLAIALLVTLVFWGYGASRHPGLFLGILASSRLASLWAEACRFLGPLVACASVIGYFVGAARARRSVQIAFVVLAALVGVGVGRTTTWTQKYKVPGPFSVTLHAATPKDDEPLFADSDAGADAAATPPSGATGSGAGPRAVADAGAGSWEPGGTSLTAPTKKAQRVVPTRPVNVLWIAVDSLRPDKIDKTNTPYLAKLIEESVYFPNTIVPMPRTGPSWTAALTSLSPLTSGIETMFPDAKRADVSTVALPAYLGAGGYRSMVVSEYAGEFFRRVKLGFDTEAVPRAELMQISGQILLSRAPLVLAQTGLLYTAGPAWRSLLPGAVEELVRGLPNFSSPQVIAGDIRSFIEAGAETKEPSFVLAFYSQPHFPYTSSPAFSRRYRVPGSSPSLAYGRDVTSDAPIATDVDRRQVDALYRAALAETDAAVAKLMRELVKTGWLDDTIIVLTADHGEGLYECAECVGHGDNLHGMMTLRVPLAFHLPARFADAKPSVQSQYVSLLDVYPTLTELIGLPRLAIMEGMPLLTATGDIVARPTQPRVHMVETGEWLWTTAAVPKDRIDYPPVTTLAHLEGERIAIDPKYAGVIRAAKHRAAIRAPYKLLYEPSRSGVRWRLFDFEADPFDTKDLAADKPEILSELKAALRRDVLRHANVLPVGDYFLTRPPGIPEDHW